MRNNQLLQKKWKSWSDNQLLLDKIKDKTDFPKIR